MIEITFSDWKVIEITFFKFQVFVSREKQINRKRTSDANEVIFSIWKVIAITFSACTTKKQKTHGTRRRTKEKRKLPEAFHLMTRHRIFEWWENPTSNVVWMLEGELCPHSDSELTRAQEAFVSQFLEVGFWTKRPTITPTRHACFCFSFFF